MTTRTKTFVRLDETHFDLADPEIDVRGRRVLDRDGEEIGEVKGLLIDDDERKVRFLDVESGGFLGIGAETRLVPVDVVMNVSDDEVHVDESRERVHAAPAYDPDLVEQPEDYWGSYYGHYGRTPYWTPGYAYPPYPYYR